MPVVNLNFKDRKCSKRNCSNKSHKKKRKEDSFYFNSKEKNKKWKTAAKTTPKRSSKEKDREGKSYKPSKRQPLFSEPDQSRDLLKFNLIYLFINVIQFII